MQASRSKMLLVIVCAFVATTFAFLGASIVSFVVASDIGKETSDLLANALPDAPIRRITVRALVEATRVHVEIEDTGPGVPPGFADVIFEPYKRAPGAGVPGLGLGLATVKRRQRPNRPGRREAAPGAGTLHPRHSG